MTKHYTPTAWVLSALVVGTVAVDPFGFAPFGPLKWTIVTAAAFAGLWLAVAGRVRVHRPSLFAWLGFLGWGVIVSLAAVDPVHTWIGTPDRRMGLLTVAGFAAAYLAAQIVRDHDIVLLGRAVTVSLWAIAISALLEALGVVAEPFAFSGDRIGGAFGTPAYLGAALVLFVPITIGIAPAMTTRFWQLAAWAGSGVGAIVLLSTQTRGALFGAAVAGAVSYPAWSRWARIYRWQLITAAVVAIVSFSLIGLGSRLIDAADFSHGAAAGRLDEWSTGIDAIIASPATGSGFEGYRVVFPSVVDAQYVQLYGRTFATDRAHNGLIDVAIWSGLIGATFYLAMMVFLARRAWQATRLGDPWLVGIGAAVLGYLAQQQFLFPLAELDGAFWVATGVLVAHTGSGTTPIQARLLTRYIALLLAAAVATFGITDVLADHLAKPATSGPVVGADIASLEDAVELRPESIRYRFLAANSNADLTQAIDHLDRALLVSPGDPILRIRRAQLLSERADRTGDTTHMQAALQTWRILAETDPHHPTVQLALGVAEITMGNEFEAESAWLLAEFLAPNSPEPVHNLAKLYASQGRDEEANQANLRAIEREQN